MLEITLPFPPSINSYWKHKVTGRLARVYISQEAVNFRARVIEITRFIGLHNKTLGTRLKVKIELFAPNNRSYDIDNRVKAVFDALTHANVWLDDELVDELTVKRGAVDKNNGHCIVIIEEIAE